MQKKLKPAGSLPVLMEDGEMFPAAGAEVEMSQYYRRRLKDGDLVEITGGAARPARTEKDKNNG
ncbi:DUF2635 domain-containing protein [Candidatus Tokpelaia sp.]|uniref:DUF2635 domain-containing protein n=1 Tax=Candidatus Tokpelaia sp. TaxID=2233777 RepID=UPI001AED51D7|nr:DUF2635 domain-containing protein [Candidatus Tokpelaia sp.]